MMRATTTALACSLLAVGMTSCSDKPAEDVHSVDGNAEEPPPVVIGGGDSAGPPSAELSDWVNYGDAVVELTVVGEEEVPPHPDDLERGEGTVARTVTVDVSAVLWEHPEAPPTPDTSEFLTAGWILRGEERVDASFEGTERFEVGERYVVALKRKPDGVVAPVGSEAVLHIEANGQVAAPTEDSEVPEEGIELAAEELAGLTPDDVGNKVAGIQRHPVAEANRDHEFFPPSPVSSCSLSGKDHLAVVSAQRMVRAGGSVVQWVSTICAVQARRWVTTSLRRLLQPDGASGTLILMAREGSSAGGNPVTTQVGR